MSRKSYVKMVISFLLALLVIGNSIPIMASPVQLSRKGSITANVPEDFSDDLGKIDVDLYQVATAVDVAGSDTYDYDVKEPYAELGIRMGLSEDEWAEMAQSAAAVTLSKDGVTPSVTGEIGDKISGLDSGLYLMIVRGEVQNNISEEDAADQELETVIRTIRYEYRFAPELISIPTKDPVDGERNTANQGDWIYDVTAMLKVSRSERKGSLEIVKTLDGQSSLQDPATFVFQIDAYLDRDNDGSEELVFSDVAGVTFSGETEKKSLVENKIPVGSRVVVTEVYSGASYTIDGDTVQEDIVRSVEQAAVVHFTNITNNQHRRGYGITNSFLFDEDEGWSWQPDTP